jgi:hypothetical protein
LHNQTYLAMKKCFFSTFLFLFLSVCSQNVTAQIESKIVLVNEDITLEVQAKNFANNLNKVIGLDEYQSGMITHLRLIHLYELKKVQDNFKLSLNDKRKEANMLQHDYDEQFSTILTAEQKFKIQNDEHLCNCSSEEEVVSED